MLGAQLHDRYRLDAQLGQGGMGIVYRARDLVLDRPVAVKLVNDTKLSTAGRAQLLYEAQVAAQLNHPNIITVFDAGEADGTPFVVMELIEGASLHEHRPTDLATTVAIARQVCAALQHAHAHGIVHRDLKPENIFLTLTGTAKLMDFGLARPVAARLTQEGALVGTVFYVAPEQALGEAVGPRADLYALGILLYELTTGRLPFTADDPLAVISQHLYAPVIPPRAHNAAIPPALEALIVRLMSKRPEDRPASAHEVEQVLAQLDLAPSSAATDFSMLDRIAQGRLIGRERELAAAKASWQRACTGQLQVLFITGEPGIGKTRVARELATRVAVTGGRALLGECYAQGGAPYAPIGQIIRQAAQVGPAAFARLPDPVLADLLTMAPDLRAQYPEVSPNPSLDPASEQQRVFESAITLFSALADQAPLLLLLDDAHWADAGTLALLQHVARRMRAHRLALALTCREAELAESRQLNNLFDDLYRRHLAVSIRLNRLTRTQTGDLLAALFAEEITPEFLEAIFRETEGNPFFVVEVCKALIESGKLSFAEGRWQRPSIAELEIPTTVQAAITGRVAQLPEAVQETLRRAAIQGREFDFALLRATSELDETALIEALERAERAQLISEIPRPGVEFFAFVHALIPTILRETLSGLRRKRLHQGVAAALEQQRPEDFEALAYHYAAAGEPERARVYLIRAGDRARRLAALIDAERHYLAALHDWPQAEAAGRAEVLLKLGECQWVTGELPRAVATLQTAQALFETLGDELKLAEVCRMLGRLHWELADRPAAMEHYQRALTILEQGPETPELARAISAISQAHMILIDFDQAIQWGERALALAERLGADDVVVHALNNLGVSRTLVHAYDQERGLAMLEESLRRAQALGLPYEIGRALYNLGESLFGLGRYPQARQRFEALLAHGMRIHSTLFTGLGVRLLMELDWRQGRWAEALARRPAAMEAAADSVMVWQGAIFAAMDNDLGQFEAARSNMETLAAQVARLDQIQTLVPCLEQLARAQAGLGRLAEATQTIAQYLDPLDRNPQLHWVCTMPALLACRWYTRHPHPGAGASAAACLQRLQRARDQMRSPQSEAALAEGQAAVAAAGCDWPLALSLAQTAAAQWETLGHPFDCVRALRVVAPAATHAGATATARQAAAQAEAIIHALAEQLPTDALRQSLLANPPGRDLDIGPAAA
jgi:tetratricopeptide (TPR) repeat protein